MKIALLLFLCVGCTPESEVVRAEVHEFPGVPAGALVAIGDLNEDPMAPETRCQLWYEQVRHRDGSIARWLPMAGDPDRGIPDSDTFCGVAQYDHNQPGEPRLRRYCVNIAASLGVQSPPADPRPRCCVWAGYKNVRGTCRMVCAMGLSLVGDMTVTNLPACQSPPFDSTRRDIPWPPLGHDGRPRVYQTP